MLPLDRYSWSPSCYTPGKQRGRESKQLGSIGSIVLQKLSGSSTPVIFWRDFSYRPLDDVIPRGLVWAASVSALQVFSCVPHVVPSSRIDCDFQILVKGRNVL